MHKKCLWRPYLCNDDQKSWNLYSWGAKGGKNHGLRRYSDVQATFLPVCRHQPPQTCWKSVFRCFTPSHQISCQNFGWKSFFEQKSKISTRWLSTFQALFLAITCQTVKLAAFTRSMASVQLPEHFKPFNGSLTPLWGSPGLELWSTSQFFQVPLFDPQIFPPETAQNRVFSNRSDFRVFRPSVKRKKTRGKARLDAEFVFSHLLWILLKF